MKEYCLSVQNEVLETCDFLNNVCQIEHPAVDSNFPYKPVHTGEFQKSFRVEGRERNILFYIPESYPPSGEAILIAPDAENTAKGYLDQNPYWKKLADEKGFMFIIMEADVGKWKIKEIQEDISYIDAIMQIIVQKELFSANEASFYFLGLGTGAYPVTAYSLARPEKIAAFVADGSFELHEKLLHQIENMDNIGRQELKKIDYPVCAWIVGNEQNSHTISYIKKTLRTMKKKVNMMDADIYMQNPKSFFQNWNDECCGELRISEKEQMRSSPMEKNEKFVEFLLQYRRWFGHENGHLRYKRTPEEMGLTLYECNHQGLNRYYYVFEPLSYKRGIRKKCPLVLAMHGYSCTGEMFAQNTQWYDVAEEKNLFVIFPTAYPGITASNCTPLPMWRNGPAEWGLQNDIDDVDFLSFVLDEVEARYPIDTGRVYVTGHSNGAVMTQILINKIPERFAAAAPVGLTHGDLGILPYENWPETELPFWLLKGEWDIGCACDMSSDSPNVHMLKLMCGQNHADAEKDYYWENGKFRNHTFYDKKMRPIVRFTEMEKLPHAYTTEMSYTIWNEFFSRFRRNEEGEIEYDG